MVLRQSSFVCDEKFLTNKKQNISIKVGDLVKVNKRCDAGGLWYKVGIVVGRHRYANGTIRDVRVLLDGRERLFNYYALDVINESR